jgi:uncharacterized protein (TIGR02996 family)
MAKIPTTDDFLRIDQSPSDPLKIDLRFCGTIQGWKQHRLNDRVYRCGGPECPACTTWRRLWREREASGRYLDNDFRSQAATYKPFQRYYCNVLMPGSWGGFKLWGFGASLYKQIVEVACNYRFPDDYESWCLHPLDFHPERIALLTAIWLRDQDESPVARLAYADWLAEHDEDDLSEAVRITAGRRFKGRKKRMNELREKLRGKIPLDVFDVYNGTDLTILRTMRAGPEARISFPEYFVGIRPESKPGMTIAAFGVVSKWEPFDLTSLVTPGDNAELDRVVNGNGDYAI